MKLQFEYLVFLYLTYSLISCAEKKGGMDKTEAKRMNLDSLKEVGQKEVRESNIEEFFVNFEADPNYAMYGSENKVPYTFSEETTIYSLPDLKSEVINRVPFATQVQFVAGLKEMTEDEEKWWKIKLANESQKYGFVRAKDLAYYQIDGNNNNSQFLLGLIVAKEKDDYLDRGEIRRYSNNGHTILERVKTVKNYGEADFRLSYTDNCPLIADKDEESLHRLLKYELFRTSCPGGGTVQYFIDDGKNLKHVIDVFSSGEAGYFDTEQIYLPIQVSNGKVLLIANADLKEVFDESKGALNVYSYPKDCKIPIEKLVVVIREKNDGEGSDMEIEPEKLPIYKTTIFYEWVGNKLVKRKEVTEKILPK